MLTVISGKLRPSTSLSGDFHGEQTCSGRFGSVSVLHNSSAGESGGSWEGHCSGVKWGSRERKGIPWDRTPLVFSRRQCVFLKLLNLNLGFLSILSFLIPHPLKKRTKTPPTSDTGEKKKKNLFRIPTCNSWLQRGNSSLRSFLSFSSRIWLFVLLLPEFQANDAVHCGQLEP